MTHTYAAYKRPTSGKNTYTDWKWSAGNKFSKETYRKKKPLFYLSPLVHYLLMPCSFLIYASCIFINIRNTSIFRSKSHFTVSFFFSALFTCLAKCLFLKNWRKNLKDSIWNVILSDLWFRIFSLTSENMQMGQRQYDSWVSMMI